MKNYLFNGDCRYVLSHLDPVQMIFADPFDNIGLGYDAYDDNIDDADYLDFLEEVVWLASCKSRICWFSFNAKWTIPMGRIFETVIQKHQDAVEAKTCVQVFTFGQHRKTDLGNNHRPLWRLRHKDAPLYPDAIKVPSWRQRNGDKRAAPGGRVPGDVFDMRRPVERPAGSYGTDTPGRMARPPKSMPSPFYVTGDVPIITGPPRSQFDTVGTVTVGREVIKNGECNRPTDESPAERMASWMSAALDDVTVCDEMKEDIHEWFETQPGDVFDFPRVTGNSKQRCDWHPTQLHEDLVARCTLLSTLPGERVVDMFGGTATTLRVCEKLGRPCTLIELDPAYCSRIAVAHDLRTIVADESVNWMSYIE